MRQIDIIGIQESDKWATHRVDAAVTGRAAAGTALVDDMEPWIAEGPDHSLGIVARAIIHDDNLEILEGLRAHRLDRGPQLGRAIVDRYHDGEKRRTPARGLAHRPNPTCPCLW